MKKDDSIRVRVPKELKRQVEAIAAEEDLELSDIARRALREFLERRGIKPGKKR